MSKVWFILVLQLVGFSTYANFSDRQARDAKVKKETEAALQSKHQEIIKNANMIAQKNQSVRATMKKK